ncbi:MAG: FAD-binding oxidoreductase [Rhodobacter sp.]|nr:FAD-binding oxidoreductase [Rhodobacter sp.]MCA3478554.1 FAD-binding oxidoreductase [Rhodobacter sp.]
METRQQVQSNIVTRVTMVLHPRPAAVATALLLFPDTAAALTLLGELGTRLPGGLLVYEAMWREFYDIAKGPMALRLPFDKSDALCLLERDDFRLNHILSS